MCSFILINDVNYLSFQRAFFSLLLLLLLCFFFFVELCRPVLYDVRNQSSFIAGGGGEGEVGAFWRDHMVFRGDGWGAVVSNRF